MVLVTILIISLLTLVPPLLMRELIDRAIPAKDVRLLTYLGLGMVAVPIFNTVIGTLQRWAVRPGRGGHHLRSEEPVVRPSPANVAGVLHRRPGRTN